MLAFRRPRSRRGRLEKAGLVFVLLFAALFASAGVNAQDPLGIAVAPFGEPYSSGAALSEEIELELELDAELLVTPSADVKGALRAKDFAKASLSDLGKAMEATGVQVLLRAETAAGGSRALILVHRAPDGAVIAAKVIVINDHVGNAGPLAQELAAVAKDVDALDPLPPAQLSDYKKELGSAGAPDEDDGRRIAGEAEPEPDDEPAPRSDEPDPVDRSTPDRSTPDRSTPDRSTPDRGTSDDEDEDEPAGEGRRPVATDDDPRERPASGRGDDEKVPAAPEKPADKADEKRLDAIDEEKKKEPDEGPKLFDRIFRATVRWAPPFLHYASCQPKGDMSDALPFLCRGEPDAPPQPTTVNPLFTPAAGALSLELYPWVPYAGLHVDASLFRTIVLLPAGIYTRDDLEILAGDAQVMGAVQGAFGFGPIGVAVGVRAGYLFLWALSSEQKVKSSNSDQTWDVTLFPGYMSHNLVLGVRGGLSLHRYVRLSVDADVIPVGYQIEWPTQIGTDTLTLGAHGRLQADLDPIFGFVLSAYVDGTALSVRSTGSGGTPRIARNLEPMNGGQANLIVIKPGFGVGYRF